MSKEKTKKQAIAKKSEKVAKLSKKAMTPIAKTEKKFQKEVKMPAKVPKVKEKQVEKKVKKEKRKKTNQEKEVLKVKDKLKAKSLPTFRGRFGARFKRRKSNKKWDKWHRPRGIDIVFKNDDGALPKIGYRTPKAIRFLHPSGLNEVIVSNLKELSKVKENVVVRFAAKIGKRKWIEMKKTAKEQKVRVLNRWKK